MIVQLDNISKIYQNNNDVPEHKVLNNISLCIEKEDSIAIAGPSGSGKSTLLNIIGTLDKSSAGSTKIFGKAIDEYAENQLAEIRNNKIGFVFQTHHLLPQLNLFENVMLPVLAQKNKNSTNNTEKRAKELLQFVGLENRMKNYPGQLSGGECQRAAVIRALINQPELLLADEPSGSLDQENAEIIGDLLTKINKEQKISLLIVTHSMNLAKKMNKIYTLSQGKLL